MKKKFSPSQKQDALASALPPNDAMLSDLPTGADTPPRKTTPNDIARKLMGR